MNFLPGGSEFDSSYYSNLHACIEVMICNCARGALLPLAFIVDLCLALCR
jgi:hypothetical protein